MRIFSKGFGSAQITGLRKDIDKLIEGGKYTYKKTEKYHSADGLKFLVVPDTNDIRSAMKKLSGKTSYVILDYADQKIPVF